MIQGFVVLNALLIGLLFWGRRRVQAFLLATPTIASPADLDRFKGLVRQQMYAAIVYLPLGLASLAWAIWIGREGNLGDLVVVLAVCSASIWIGQDGKANETKARNLPASDALAAEYQAVAKAWESKLLPSF